MQNIVIVGGTGGLGRELAVAYLERGDRVVISGRDATRAKDVAAALSESVGTGEVHGIATDLRDPAGLAGVPAELDAIGMDRVDTLVLAGIARDANSVADYDIAGAIELVTVKLVGYTAMTHLLKERLTGSVLLFGGGARFKPYPGSTTVSTVNGGVIGMMQTLSLELAPVRVNVLHPGVVVDSPFWEGKTGLLEPIRQNTLTGRLATMADIVGAALFLGDNQAANRVEMLLDGGIR